MANGKEARYILGMDMSLKTLNPKAFDDLKRDKNLLSEILDDRLEILWKLSREKLDLHIHALNKQGPLVFIFVGHPRSAQVASFLNRMNSRKDTRVIFLLAENRFAFCNQLSKGIRVLNYSKYLSGDISESDFQTQLAQAVVLN